GPVPAADRRGAHLQRPPELTDLRLLALLRLELHRLLEGVRLQRKARVDGGQRRHHAEPGAAPAQDERRGESPGRPSQARPARRSLLGGARSGRRWCALGRCVAVVHGVSSVLDGTALDGTALDGTALDGTALDGTVLDGTAPCALPCGSGRGPTRVY